MPEQDGVIKAWAYAWYLVLCLCRTKMSSPSAQEISLRDYGTQLHQSYLAPHLREYEAKNRNADEISQERIFSSTPCGEKKRTRNWSFQSSKFGPIGERGILKHVVILHPPKAWLEQLREHRQRSTILNYGDETSKFKKSFYAQLLKTVKEQARGDLLFKSWAASVCPNL